MGTLLSVDVIGCGRLPEQTVSIYGNQEKLGNVYSSYELEMAEQDITDQHMRGEIEGLEGMVMLWMFETNQNIALNLTWKMKVTSGRAKLILVSPDNSVTTIEEYTAHSGSEDYQSLGFSAKEGLNRIKIVGTEGADVEFDISVNGGSFLAFGE